MRNKLYVFILLFLTFFVSIANAQSSSVGLVAGEGITITKSGSTITISADASTISGAWTPSGNNETSGDLAIGRTLTASKIFLADGTEITGSASQEEIEDYIDGLISDPSSVKTRITISYTDNGDGEGYMSYVVDPDLANYDWTSVLGSVVQAYSANLADLADGTLSKTLVEDSVNWDSAYGWGNHALANYLDLDTYSNADTDSTDDLVVSNIGTTVQAYNSYLADLSDGTLSTASINTTGDIETAGEITTSGVNFNGSGVMDLGNPEGFRISDTLTLDGALIINNGGVIKGAQTGTNYTAALIGDLSASGSMTANAFYTHDGSPIGGSSDKVYEGDTSVECVDSGTDGVIQFKVDDTTVLEIEEYMTVTGNNIRLGGEDLYFSDADDNTIVHFNQLGSTVNSPLTCTGNTVVINNDDEKLFITPLDLSDFILLDASTKDIGIDGNVTIGESLTVDSLFLADGTEITGSGTVTNLDAIGDVDVMTEADNDILFYDVDAWNRLPRGTDGQVLKYTTANGLEWGDASASGATTDAGTVTHVTSSTDDFAVGGTDNTADLFIDVSEDNAIMNADLSANGTLSAGGVLYVKGNTIRINNPDTILYIEDNSGTTIGTFHKGDLTLTGCVWVEGTTKLD